MIQPPVVPELEAASVPHEHQRHATRRHDSNHTSRAVPRYARGVSEREPLQLVVDELREVADSLVAQDRRHGRRSQIAERLRALAQELEATPDPKTYPPIASELKGLAKELNVPIVALSQLSRAPDARADDTRNARNLAEAALRLARLAPG